MALMNAGAVLQMIQNYRMVWLSGRFSGGKTSLAFEIAKYFGGMGYRIITNTKSIWADNPLDVELDKHGHLKAVVILDEGGTEFKTNNQVEQISAYCAKMDIIFLVPSFFPPARKFQVLEIQPVWNLKPVGIPYIQYNWAVQVGTFKDKGAFGWFYPQSIFGVYSRQDPGAYTDSIVNFLIQRKEEFRSLHGKSRGAFDGIPEMGRVGLEGQELFSDAVEGLERGISEFSSIFD